MRKFTTKDLTFAALIAAAYAALTLLLPGPSYGYAQLRVSEALTVLPFLFPQAAPGLLIGCLAANLLSPYGPLDWLFGTLATAIAAYLTMKMPKWYLAALPPVIVNALILAPMWAWTDIGTVNAAFWMACGWNAVTFIPSEALVCYVLGTLLLKLLPQISVLRPAMRQTTQAPTI